MQGKEGHRIKPEILRCGDCRIALEEKQNQIPKFLNCLHALCGQCISKMVASHCSVCPVCNLPIDISSDSAINAIPSISFLQNMGRFERIVDQLSQKEVRKECQNCSDRNAATHWCTDHDMPLLFCSECVYIYNNFQTNGQKIFKALQNTRADDVLSYVRQSGGKSCLKHGGDLEIFCEECMTLICQKCNHSGHPMVYIEDEAAAIRDRIGDKVQDWEKTKGILQRRSRYVEDEKVRLAESSKVTTKHIHLFFDKLRESIDRREKQLTDTVDRIARAKSAILDEDAERVGTDLSDITALTEFLTATKEFSNDGDLMAMSGYLKNRAGEYISTRTTDEPDANGSISFGSGEFIEIRVPLLQSKHFEEIYKRIPMSVEQLGEIKETRTVASETKFRIKEGGSGLEIVIEAHMKDQHPCKHGGDSFSIEIKAPNDKITTPLLVDLNTGSYSTNFTPRLVGKYKISINFHGRPIRRSPYIFEMEEQPRRTKSCGRFANVPEREPPPPPLPTSPRPRSSGYVTMKGFVAPKERSDRPLQRALTTSSMMTSGSKIEYGVDVLDIERYHGTRRTSRRGSSVYQTIDSLGLDVKEQDEKKLDALGEKALQALREKFKPTKPRKKSGLLRWVTSQTDQ